jgi:glycosyltransferase involved in cell wall biosynthesis
MATLTVITPTKGRPSLSATIASVTPQLEHGDELIVVADLAHGPHPYARGLCRLAQDGCRGKVVYAELAVEGSQYGNAQRDFGLKLAGGSHLAFLDDDDVWTDDAGALIHEAIDLQPHYVHVFKAEWGPGHHAHGTILWKEPHFVEGQIGTPMVVWPRHHAMPRWMDSNERGVVSDFGWMSAALGATRIGWHPRIVATVRPEAQA